MGREGVRILELEAMNVSYPVGQTLGQRIPWGKPWYSHPISGKRRRKWGGCPGLAGFAVHRTHHLLSLGRFQKEAHTMKNHLVDSLCLSVLLLAPAVAQHPRYPFSDPNLPAERRIENLLSLMTTDEKIDCLGTRTGVPRLGVPNIGSAEGIHGVVQREARGPPLPIIEHPAQ